MRMYDVIKKKRDGLVLTKSEIDFFVDGYVNGEIPDYQAAALLMAIFERDMTFDETQKLTYAIRDSGEKLSLSDVRGTIVDKHSTGGVGDATSLVVAPIAAACGVNVAMISGRGLGHTGGTLDKLEAIPGYNAMLSPQEFEKIISRHGLSIIGQTENIAPADRKLYALRDVTATVDKIPLIASSIMGKKLAEGCDSIVFDVKMGCGAFMKTYSEAQMLANTLYHIAVDAGKRAVVLITNMEEPLGNTIGNSLEVLQAIATMKNDGPEDFTVLCIELAANMIYLGGKGDIADCRKLAEKALKNGSAFKKFKAMVAAHGGDVDAVDKPELLPKARYSMKVKSRKKGILFHQDAEKYGIASCILGAGRLKKEDKVDPAAGIVLYKKCGDEVDIGDVIAVLYSNNPDSFSAARDELMSGTVIENMRPQPKHLIFKRIGGAGKGELR